MSVNPTSNGHERHDRRGLRRRLRPGLRRRSPTTDEDYDQDYDEERQQPTRITIRITTKMVHRQQIVDRVPLSALAACPGDRSSSVRDRAQTFLCRPSKLVDLLGLPSRRGDALVAGRGLRLRAAQLVALPQRQKYLENARSELGPIV